MRQFFILCIVCFSSFLIGQDALQKKAVDLQFESKHIDLGKVKQGDKRTFQYSFTNAGTEDVEIQIVSGCDCTTLNWTKGKIKPGEKGVIDVIFDSTTKTESETVDVDIYLENIDPKWDANYLIVLDYSFELIK